MTIQGKVTQATPAAEEVLRRIERELAARRVVAAVLDCDPRDRLSLLELLVDHYRPGQPVPAFDGVMEEAAYWADMASEAELKAYALASYNRLSSESKSAFLQYVRGGSAI